MTDYQKWHVMELRWDLKHDPQMPESMKQVIERLLDEIEQKWQIQSTW